MRRITNHRLPNPRLRCERIILQGDPPDPIRPLGALMVFRFQPRFPLTQDICLRQDPSLRTVSEDQESACLLV